MELEVIALASEEELLPSVPPLKDNDEDNVGYRLGLTLAAMGGVLFRLFVPELVSEISSKSMEIVENFASAAGLFAFISLLRVGLGLPGPTF